MVARFGNLYARRVEARGAIGAFCTSMKTIGTQLNGIVTSKNVKPSKEPNWNTPAVQDIRTDLFHTMVVVFHVVKHVLVEENIGYDLDGKEKLKQCMAKELKMR